MTKEIEHLQYLDYIINFLKSSPNYTNTYNNIFEGIIKFLEKMNKEKDIFHFGFFLTDKHGKPIVKDDITLVDFTNTPEYQKQVFKEAIEYLISLKVIREIRPEFNAICLTYEGHMKITKTFVDEFKKSEREKAMKIILPNWQIVGIIGAIIFGFSGIAFGIYTNYHKDDSHCKCCEHSQKHPNKVNDKKKNNKKTHKVFSFSEKISHNSMGNKKAVQ